MDSDLFFILTDSPTGFDVQPLGATGMKVCTAIVHIFYSHLFTVWTSWLSALFSVELNSLQIEDLLINSLTHLCKNFFT